jgi:hypothetical protein
VTDPYTDEATPKRADAAPPVALAPMTLFRVDGRGRVNLSGVVADDVEFYSAVKGDGGMIILAPVQIATTSIKRGATGDETASA